MSTPQDDDLGGYRLGSVAGVPVVLSGSWFFVAALITLSFAPIFENELPELGGFSYAVSFVFAVLLYASIFIHELGHTLVARGYGLPVRRISIQFLGGASEISTEPPTPGKAFNIAAAGPALSLILGGIGYFVLKTFEFEGVIRLIVVQLTFANLFVGVFNLLPGLPLDGGHLVRSAVWAATRKPVLSTKVAGWAGRVVSVLVLALPFILQAIRGGNPDLVSVVWAAFLAAFIWAGANQAIKRSEIDARLPSVTAKALTRRAMPVRADTPVALAVQRAQEAGVRGLVVVDGLDRPFSIVSEAAVEALPVERRPWVAVADVAKRIDDDARVSVELEGTALLQHLATHPQSEYLVITPSGEIFGVLSASDVETALDPRR